MVDRLLHGRRCLAWQPEGSVQPGDLDQEELLMTLGDVLTEVASGHLDGHRCPVCAGGTLLCGDADGKIVRVTVPS